MASQWLTIGSGNVSLYLQREIGISCFLGAVQTYCLKVCRVKSSLSPSLDMVYKGCMACLGTHKCRELPPSNSHQCYSVSTVYVVQCSQLVLYKALDIILSCCWSLCPVGIWDRCVFISTCSQVLLSIGNALGGPYSHMPSIVQHLL